MFDRLRFLRLINAIHASGGYVTWDDYIGEHENGFADAQSGQPHRGALKRLILGTPHNVMFSSEFKGSERFRSGLVKELRRLPNLNRVAISGLSIVLADIQPLVLKRSLRSIGLYDTGLTDDDVRFLRQLAGDKIRIDVHNKEVRDSELTPPKNE